MPVPAKCVKLATVVEFGTAYLSYHQERSNDPIHKDTESNLDPDCPLVEDVV